MVLSDRSTAAKPLERPGSNLHVYETLEVAILDGMTSHETVVEVAQPIGAAVVRD
jgi:hypothetical protein